MNSTTNKLQEEKQKQLELRRQIALLQSQLKNLPADDEEDHAGGTSGLDAGSRHGKSKSKRKETDAEILIPATPSPKKKRKVVHNQGSQGPRIPALNLGGSSSSTSTSTATTKGQNQSSNPTPFTKPRPSNLLQQLSTIPKRIDEDHAEEQDTTSKRTARFRERPKALNAGSGTDNNHAGHNTDRPSTSRHSPPCENDTTHGVNRDDRLAIIQEFEIGPQDHKPPFDDPLFEQLEPNSGIRLSSRKLPHEDLQEFLRGRFYLSPSNLYSSIRLLPDKQSYDVPVPGDWVTIAVVAERGPIRLTKASVGIGPDEDEVGSNSTGKGKGKGSKAPATGMKKGGKRYVNFKLVDFGARSKGTAAAATGGSGSGAKPIIRGDAFLSLLLFESDGFEVMFKNMDEDNDDDDDDEAHDSGQRKPRGKGIEVDTTGRQNQKDSKKVLYKGGSGGAFEQLYKLNLGDVIALLNPKVLKPLDRSSTPHPSSNILAVTPISAGSIEVVGRAKDYGRCTVVKRDGKRCESWMDRRVSDVCEWHLQNAVERRRAARPEFAVGTSGLSTSAVRKRHGANGGSSSSYDPSRQWGLTPESNFSNGTGSGSGATYVLSGHIIRNPSSGVAGGLADSLFVSENMGREGQARARRKMEQRQGDLKVLKALMEKDREGMRDVIAAREVLQNAEGGGDEKGKGKTTNDKDAKGKGNTMTKEEKADGSSSAKGYSANVIKRLGFDPTLKILGNSNGKPGAAGDTRKKLDALVAIQKNKKVDGIELGRRPGRKIRSGVLVPDETLKERRLVEASRGAHDSASASEDEGAGGERLIDLDSDY